MMWKPFFAAACAAALAVPAAFAQGSTGGGKPSLSFSFANGNGTNHILVSSPTGDPLGIEAVPVANWIDLVDEDNGTINAVDVIPAGDEDAYNFTLPAPVTVSYSAKNGYEYVTDDTQTFLQAYLDDGENPNNDNKGARITVEGVPFTRYDVIVYLATDTGSAKFLPVTVNENKYIGIEEAEGGSQKVTDNTTTWGVSQQAVANLGKNALRVNGLSDATLTIQGTPNSVGGGRCGIAAFQIICADGGALRPSTQPVLSLNFASGRSPNDGGITESKVATETGNYGLAVAPADTWVDLTGAVDTDTQRNVTKLHGNPTAANWSAATVTWKAKNTWSYDSDAAEAAEPFLPTYLDDGEGNGADGVAVSVASVPFEAYDAIVYLANDAGRKYRPLQVNGSYYTYDAEYGAVAIDGAPLDGSVGAANRKDPNAFGDVSQKGQAALGVNALRVNGLTGDFSLKGEGVKVQTGPETGLVSDDYDRSGIAAVQLVARQLITVSGQADWATLTADLDLTQPLLVVVQKGASITGGVTLPADTILDLSAYTFGDTLPINGTLTMNGGTIRLPGGFESGKIATVFSGNNFHCFIAGKPVWLKLDGDTGTLAASYLWTDQTGNHLWSDPGNWDSLIVPGTGSNVFFKPAASQTETVILDKAATVASVTITGSESSAATLAIQAQEGGSLTVSGQMLTTGNVTVTQSANITVQGETVTGTWPCQAGFHIHQGTWKILSGKLAMPTDGGANTGEAGISGGGTLIVGGGDASVATLAVRQIRHMMYEQVLASAYGTLRVAAGGTLTAYQAVSLAVNYGHTYTVDLAGGTLETPTLATFAGVTVSDDSSLRAPNGGTLNVTLPRGSSGDALTGEGDVTLSGTVTIPSELTDYTGTLTVSAGSALTLSAPGARPNLVLEDGVAEDKTALTVTPSTGEAALGEIVFPTAMKAAPENVTYTVLSLAEGTAVEASVADGTLTLSWAVAYPTLAQTGSWSEAAKWTNVSAETAPAAGVAILDGTSAPITVMLDKALTGMTSIVVRGDVSLETTKNQATIPACVTLAEGATLGVGATSFGDTWALPAGTTLRIKDAGFSLVNIQTANSYTQFAGNVEIVFSNGSIGDSAGNPIRIDGTLSIKGSNVTFTNLGLLAGDVDLLGNNICLDRERAQEGGTTSGALGIGSDGTTILTSCGNGNRIAHATRLNGTIDVQSGSLALLTEQPGDISTTSPAYYATIAEGATLILEEKCAGGQYPATGAGTYAVGTNRPQFAAVGGATTTPAIITATATEAEQSAGTITFANYQSAVSFPEGFEAKITPPYGAAAPWVTVAKAGGNTLRILNVPAPNGLTGLDDEVALALRQAAAKEGITNGNYTVQLTTGGGQPVETTAATLNDVLGCFTGLTVTANDEKTMLTYAYEFGISGVRRTAEGWEVVVKVTGADGAPAGFAVGNVYTVKDATVKSLDVSKAAQGEVVLSVAGELKEVSVSVDRPAEAAEQP